MFRVFKLARVITICCISTLYTVISYSLGLAKDGITEELPVIGKPVSGGINFQPPVTELARDILWLDNILLVIITIISLFVLGLMLWVFIRYNKRANKVASTTTHNTPIEIAWTIVPVFILIGIILPTPDSMVQKRTGHFWF